MKTITRLLLLSVVLALGRAAAEPVPVAPSAGGRVLIVTTSHAVLGRTGYPTGVWLPEVTHPYFELTQAGFEVDLASVAGGRPPIDPYSDPANPNGINRDDIISTGFLQTPAHAAKLASTLKLAEVDASQYRAVVFAGGNGAVFDLRGLPEAERLVRVLWKSGGTIAALCHGTAALLDVKLDDGSYLVAGEKVTGFSNAEEKIAQAQIGAGEYLPFYLETELGKRGARFESTAPFQPFVTVGRGGRLITGQQNFSGGLLGRALVARLKAGGSPESVAGSFFRDFWNARAFGWADTAIPSSSVSSSLISGVPVEATKHPRDAAAMKAHGEEWIAAFPDLRFTTLHTVAQGEMVATFFAAHGTQKGVWFGLRPTGREADIKGALVQKVVDGRVVEDWVLVDLLGVLQQLGVTQPLPQLIEAANSR